MGRLLLVVLSIFLICCYGATNQVNHSNLVKIKGLVFTGPGTGPLQDDSFSSMVNCNGNFVALVPEATVYRQNLEVDYNFKRQWYGETREAIFDGISKARNNGLKVMIKPHLNVGWDMSNWDEPEIDINDSLSFHNYAKSASGFIQKQDNKIIGNSGWRGELMTKSEKDWNVFEREYTNFIMDYAKISDSLKVELFCIGTELKRIALEKPEFRN